MSTDDGPTADERPLPEILTGSGAILRSLEMLGITDVFGLPGGAIMPFYDELMASTAIRHILVRHEQGAGHAAEGYAASSGRVGVAIATSGPGATNLVTAIADAHMDSVPLLAITGQVFSTSMGTDAFQEVDIVGITMPITKHSFLVTRPEDIPATLAAAYHIATTGRPGPVLVDITKDAQQNSAPVHLAAQGRPARLPARSRRRTASRSQAAAQLLAEAERPVFYVGGGVDPRRAPRPSCSSSPSAGAPVVTTLMARGAFPDSHPQHLGMPGMHGTVPAVLGLQESDLHHRARRALRRPGHRQGERVRAERQDRARRHRPRRDRQDPRRRRADRGRRQGRHRRPHRGLRRRDEGAEARLHRVVDAPRHAARAVPARLHRARRRPARRRRRSSSASAQLTGPEAIYAAGVGQHQMWAAQFIKYERPNSWLNSGGAGTMGYAVPAAMGAKVAKPDRVVWAIDGDGCFQMTNQELATCTINNIPIKVAIINNSSLGMVRQWQTLFYDGRHSFTDLNTGHGHRDDPRLREARRGVRLPSASASPPRRRSTTAIKLALETNDRPVVIDFIVSRDAMVWPMVPQGVGNSQVQYASDHAPDWEEE